MPRKRPQKIDTRGGGSPLADNPFGQALSSLGDLPPSDRPAKPSGPSRDPVKKPFSGTVSVRRETKGRGGKAVCVVYDFPPGRIRGELKEILKSLQKATATGGTVKDGTIEIQGEHLKTVMGALGQLGFSPKQRGG